VSGKLKTLTYDQALASLHHKDSRLANMHTSGGLREWFMLSPGGSGRVKPDDAARLLARSDIRGQRDSLFPGLDQTFRLVR
jgi:hypothetical protein